FFQGARFDDDRAIAKGRRSENRLERICKRLALRLDRDCPSAAEKGNGISLVGETQWICGEFVASHPHELKRVFRIIDGTRNNLARPLADETGIRAKEKIQIDMRR